MLSASYIFELFSDETQNWPMDFWIPQRVLMHDIRVKYSGKLLTIFYWKWSRSHNFYPKFSKMQPLKMNLRSQIEPSVKRYESFMFIVFAEFQIGNHHKMMDSWKPSIIFFLIRETVKLPYITKTNQTRNVLCEFEVGVFFGVILSLAYPSG